jgi:radical SAM protein with 4Fe4S-binding SPASM domain
MHFRLNPECYLIVGGARGAIYDLIDEKIYDLNQHETKLVIHCEKNKPVRGDEELLCDLKQRRLGNFYSNIPYIQKLRAGSPYLENEGDPPALYRAFLEINNECNRDCWFCGYHGIKRSLGCIGCNKWDESGETLGQERWKEIIDELKDLDCRDIYITGGDLTLVWDRAIEILDYAKGKFKNIYMTLHQRSLSPGKINYLNKKANLIIQTDDPSAVQVTDFAILLIVTPESWKAVDDIRGKNMRLDFVIKDKSILSNDIPIISKKKILPVNLFQFQNNLEYHPCLGHTLAINYNGKVTPCPMMRKYSFGVVGDKELYTVFQAQWETINKFWKLNLNEIEKCTGCEFRYSCDDCRALEDSLTGRLTGKMLCSYNPTEGDWM